MYHHVGKRKHTPVVCNESREPHTSHNPNRPRNKKNSQQTTHTSQYLSWPVETDVLKKLRWYTSLKKTICNKFLRTHPCHSQSLEHRAHCRNEELLKFAASKNCQLADRRANDRAFHRDTWWNIHCSRLKNPVLPSPPVEKCIHCLLLRDTSESSALQPRWWWIPGCMKNLNTSIWARKSIHKRDIPH